MVKAISDIWKWLWANSWCARTDCGIWDEWMPAIHIWADRMTAVVFTLIPLGLMALWYMKRHKLHHAWYLICSSLFILSCGVGHEIDSWSFDKPVYNLLGVVKVCTTILGWITFLGMIYVAPKAITLKGSIECEEEVQKKTSELRAANEFQTLILENCGTSMFVLDMEGRVTYVNSTASSVFGFSRDEMMGQKLHDLIHYKHPDGTPFPMADCPLAVVFAGQASLNDHQDIFWHKDGQAVHVLCNHRPVIVDGNIISAILSVRDITPMIRHQEEINNQEERYKRRIEDSEERLRLAVEASGLGTWDYDIPTEVVEWSPNMYDMFGVASHVKPVPISVFYDHIIPDDREDVLKAVTEAIGNNQDYHCEYTTTAGRHVFAKGRIFRRNGQPARMIGAVNDVTTLHRKNEQLALMNQRKDDFLAMLGHELRNPLAAMTNARHILEVVSDEDDESRDLAMGALKNQLEHVTRLVDDMLDVTRAIRGTIKFKKEPLDFAEVVERGIQIAEPLVESMGHHIDVFQQECHLLLVGDKIRLIQVVSNLVVNSAKYTPSGGQITVICRREGDCIQFSVKDTGIGIDPDRLEEVFELCFRTDEAANKENGLGMGLTIARLVVQHHGGTIEARSEGKGKGSEFIVRLPLSEERSTFAQGAT